MKSDAEIAKIFEKKEANARRLLAEYEQQQNGKGNDMKADEALKLLISIALSFMNQIGEENQAKVLEARTVLRKAIKPIESEKKDE